MRTYKLLQVDAFTDKLFGGNPAAVVFNAESLSDIEMKQITREMNLSETAFILPSEIGNFCLRYFTPSGNEIKFCGHATVGALHAIASENEFGITKAGTYPLKVETNSGLMDMLVDYKKENEISIQFNSPEIDLVIDKYSHEVNGEALGIDIQLIDKSVPVMRDRTNNYVYLKVKSLKDLERINYDVKKAYDFAFKDGTIIFCIMVNETFDKKNQIHSRCFAPLVGVSEDPATGSAQGALAAYALLNKLISENGEIIGLEQGHFINRPSQINVKLIKEKEKFKATVFARAISVFKAELKIN